MEKIGKYFFRVGRTKLPIAQTPEATMVTIWLSHSGVSCDIYDRDHRYYLGHKSLVLIPVKEKQRHIMVRER